MGIDFGDPTALAPGLTAFHGDRPLRWFLRGDGAIHALSVAADGTLYGAGDEFYRYSPEGRVIERISLASPCVTPSVIDARGVRDERRPSART